MFGILQFLKVVSASEMDMREVTRYQNTQNPVDRTQISARYSHIGQIIHSPVRIKSIISQSQREES
jgi:hypothetical protein